MFMGTVVFFNVSSHLSFYNDCIQDNMNMFYTFLFSNSLYFLYLFRPVKSKEKNTGHAFQTLLSRRFNHGNNKRFQTYGDYKNKIQPKTTTTKQEQQQRNQPPPSLKKEKKREKREKKKKQTNISNTYKQSNHIYFLRLKETYSL